MKKRWLSMAAVLTAAGILLAGCGTSGGTSTTAAQGQGGEAQESGTGETQAAEGTKTYTMFMRGTFIDWIGELKWYDEAEKRTGVHVEYVKGPNDQEDAYAEVDQRLISGTLPDAAMCRQAQANVYGSQGAFRDLAPLIEEYAPNIQAYLDENPDYAALVTNDDGTIYGLLNETPKLADFVFYRADHFRKAGVDPSQIKTVDDFTQAMKTLKEYYGKDNPNYYPLCGRDTFFRYAAWFDCANNISAEESNGIYYNAAKDGMDIYADNFYHMMEVLKGWYDDGLVNPEWVAGSYSEGDWEAAMLNGDCSIGYDFMTRPQWFLDNGGPDIDPDYEIAVLDNIEDENGNIKKYQVDFPYNEQRATVINAATDDETAQTIIQFIDYFWGEEGQTLCSWGVEGESYQVVDGKKEFIVDYSTEESKPAGEKKWSFLNDRYTVCKPVDDEAFYAWNGDVVKDAAARLFDEDHLMDAYNIKYTEDQLEELSTLTATLNEQVKSNLTGFVTGRTELNEANWQAFLDDMDSKGYSRVEEIQLEAFRSTYDE
ncbi:MAG TPA: hypothetical protein IAA51_09445 [Candidatus Cottocaccamicrobium excrementipullorum]|nr:hypothetical protein [Candidatus Cottocaccamicrobium excrementipullorum]